MVARTPDDLAGGRPVLLDAVLTVDGLEARCDALTRTGPSSGLGAFSYEPVKVVGTPRIDRQHLLGLAYLGYVLNEVQHRLPAAGTLVQANDRPRRVKLVGNYKEVRRIIEMLQIWTRESSEDAPPVVLNKHCPICPFRECCREQAEKEDNLSLLDRMTPRLLKKYHGKGIFTINQLSYLFKPRRNRKNIKRQVQHSLELQALAIRTGKTYIQHLPDLPHHGVELFVDVEGIPDRKSYYLIGLLVCKGGNASHQACWADGVKEEGRIWSDFVEQAEKFPDAPIYHYGSYERKAFQTLARRHGRGEALAGRLINVASSVYGKVYFPVRSNGLKVLGRLVGATWTFPEASGLMSLVWRHRWEVTRHGEHRRALIQYNREDCEALRRLVEALRRIGANADSEPTVDFAHRPKQTATDLGMSAHRQFERILQYAQEGGRRRSLLFRAGHAGGEDAPDAPRKKGAPKGHRAYQRMIPARSGRTVRVRSKRTCPRHHEKLVSDPEQLAEKVVIDLVFSRNGCRKTVTKYCGWKGYCPKCDHRYDPPALDTLCKHAFGHAFQAWAVYQRVILRLPYRIITQVMEHLFGVGLSAATVVNFLRYLAGYYAETAAAILDAIRKSDFVHVDETKINIQGVEHYIWVFTNGSHVIFRMTESREADIVREVLADYEGVLVSDFYPGYDSLPCRQQKCLVHLIRDLNDDLWKAPFDREFEALALEVRSLLVPILETVDLYGLKTRYLRKFWGEVDRFYDKNVVGREYTSELVIKYQKRFLRYRDGLFMFLTQNGIPWNNNMAERAIRHLAVQRKISGTFFKRAVPQYLLLLAIAQTCRFQEKSFLKFMLSRTKDIDQFRPSRPIEYSVAVVRRPAAAPA